MSEDNIALSDSIQFAPFRSINEFLLDKARYQAIQYLVSIILNPLISYAAR